MKKRAMFKIFRKIENRLLRILAIILAIVIVFVAVVIIFISPITKYFIEHYSEKYIHRKVQLSWIYVNPFTGYINAHGVQVYEPQSDSTFLKLNNLTISFSPRKLLSKNLDVSYISLDQLWLNVIQHDSVFNFSDLMKKDTAAIDTAAKKSPFHISVRNIHLGNSEIHYNETTIPVHYYITKVNLECLSYAWNQDTSLFRYDFYSGTGSGQVTGRFTLNFKNDDYNTQTTVTHFDLKPMEQYVKDFANYGNLEATLDASMNASGNTKIATALKSSGKAAITNFHFGKVKGDDYASFSKLSLNIDSLSPANKKYFFSALILDSPFLKYEKYDSLDNFSRMFGQSGSNVKQAEAAHPQNNIIFQIAHYVSQIAKEIVNSQYRVNNLQIQNMNLYYTDFSLVQTFSVNANPIVITARNIDTRNSRMYLTLNCRTNPFGQIDVNFDVNPKDFGDFHLQYNIHDLPLPLFNPYTVSFSSYPFDKGMVAFYGTWNVINKGINSTNHLVINNPTTADKVKNNQAKNVPVPLIMAFIRDFDRRIDVEIPVEGNLNDPHFNLWDVILHIIENIFIKPPTFPYRQTAYSSKQAKEDYILMEWKPMQFKMNEDQEDQLQKISYYMFWHPQSKLIISPVYFTGLEKETILFYEAKKKYYAHEHHVNPDSLKINDSLEISKMSVKDKGFINYLNKATKASPLEFTVQEKCKRLIGQEEVNKIYGELLEQRKREIEDYFHKTADRVSFKPAVSTIPASGFSHYIFNYKGTSPTNE